MINYASPHEGHEVSVAQKQQTKALVMAGRRPLMRAGRAPEPGGVGLAAVPS